MTTFATRVDSITSSNRCPVTERGSWSREPVAVKVAVAVLATATLVCAGLVAVPLWQAIVGDPQRSDIALVECARLKSSDQEACYIKLRLKSQRSNKSQSMQDVN
jgi:hypothetical protein